MPLSRIKQNPLYSLFEESRTPMAIYNEKKIILAANPLFCQQLQKLPEDMLYKSIEDLLQDGGHQIMTQRQILSSTDSNDQKETLYLIQLVEQPELSQVKALQKLLETNSKMVAVGRVAGGIAHEINNPLTILSLYMDRLDKISLDSKISQPELKKIATQSKSTIKRIVAIIRSMKNISHRVDERDLELVDLHEVIQDSISLGSEKFNAEGVFIEYLPPEESIFVKCHQVELAQVFINLINNSYDAIKKLEEKLIRIELKMYHCEKTEQSSVQILVQDSGNGVPKELETKILEPFFTTKSVGEGSGLGLSISKTILKKINGDLYYLPNKKMTTFVINLPIFQNKFKRETLQQAAQ